MTDATDDGRSECTALVVHPCDAALLVTPSADGPRLPVVELPYSEYGYKPEPLTTATGQLTGLDVALLRQFPARHDEQRRTRHFTAVFATRDSSGTARPGDGLVWWSGATGHPVADTVLAELAGTPVDSRRPPWFDRGFLPIIEEWARERLAAAGTPLTGPLDQVRIWELSYVLSAPTTAGRVFIKATADSPLWPDEGTAVAALSKLFPGDIPAPLAVDPERRWMVLPDLGPTLGWADDQEEIDRMIRAFARMQITSTGHLDELWRAGCVDRRLPWLVDHATSWLSAADLTRWLDPDEATRVRGIVREIPGFAARLAGFGLPDTLLHGDMHAGNVARRPGGFAFFDWSDAGVGHPFTDMIAIRNATDPAHAAARLDAYLDEWHEFGSPAALRAAWDAAETMTALHHAVSYASIVTALEPPPEADMEDEVGRWLRLLLAAADR